MTETNRIPVTVLGLGMMGTALAGAFLNNGNRTIVWNRSADKTDALIAEGAVAAGEIRDAVEASPVIVICVSTYEVMNDLLASVADELRGRVVVNLTSGTPEEARDTALWAQENGVEYLDGAIMAVPQMIGLPEALIFYAGNQQVFTEQEELLKPLGGKSVYLGTDAGVPMIYDLGLLSILWSCIAGYVHAQALVGTVGVSAEEFLPFVNTWIEQVIAPAIPKSAKEIDSGRFETDVSSLDVNKAAISHLVKTSKQLNVDNDMSVAIQEMIEKRVAQGHGNHSLASLIEAFKKQESH
ncbi:NAD(P)-dependent oxidoreductase [Actinopolyspora sp. H202]|uniref:NAD(P)-dependent oxidoreductase n=1 Tax=Actinopolyspora sp. H202 TaxID=1500456 RepID=UPI003EE4433A